MSEILELIEKQKGSDGKSGWPVCVKDRIAYYGDKQTRSANVAVTFLWTIRDDIVPKLEKENLAIATNFYTPAGLESMLRNILANPYIRYLILLGNEYSLKKPTNCESKCSGKKSGLCDGKTCSEQTSANAIRTFFEKGIDKNRKLPGFENSVYFDKNIPTEMIEKVRNSVQLIDLNKKMQGSTLDEKIKKANYLIKTLEKKPPFLEKPMIFDYEKSNESFSYAGGPIIVHGSTIPKTWIEIIYMIYRYGKKNLMDAETDRWIKEINNFVAVIHEPQSIDLSINPFLVPLTIEKIQAYQKEILSPTLPEGKAYTYGNKLRAYLCNSSKEIKDLINSKDFHDFEFGKGPHLDKNIKYIGSSCEIDQISDIIDLLKRNLYSKSAVAITWYVQDELMRKHKSSPCLVLLQPLVQDNKLNLTVFFQEP